jgi:hypothetical protein
MNVPASTPIRRNRVHNIDTDRLIARREFLVTLCRHNSGTISTRHMFAMRAAELSAIETEMFDRGIIFNPVTRTHENVRVRS